MKLIIIFTENFKQNKMGRKKLTNERFQISCHPKVIKDVRRYAKEVSEIEVNKTKTLDIK